LIPLLNDPLQRGWHLLPALANYRVSFALAQASTVWYAQIVLIVIGHVIAVYLSHLRAGERFRTAQRALLSQYPMLLLMVMYTMTSLWILAQPITRETG
jgi:ABC-type molybdate transport system ATPase subunit